MQDKIGRDPPRKSQTSVENVVKPGIDYNILLLLIISVVDKFRASWSTVGKVSNIIWEIFHRKLLSGIN